LSNHPEIIIVPSLFFMIGYIVWVLANAWHRGRRLKMVTDFNGKLLDRLGSVKDFSEFLQTEAGGRFMQDLGSEPQLASGPQERILRATQLGTVLVCLGLGLLLLSFLSPLSLASAQPQFNAIGTIALSLGIGFILSAVASYRLATALGLLGRAPDAPAVTVSSHP
jgi:hypothetical protein